MDRLRRRLRSNGFRAHLTLQMVPEDSDMVSNVHITPLRASRALSLRYLANKFNLDMERITVSASLSMDSCHFRCMQCCSSGKQQLDLTGDKSAYRIIMLAGTACLRVGAVCQCSLFACVLSPTGVIMHAFSDDRQYSLALGTKLACRCRWSCCLHQ